MSRQPADDLAEGILDRVQQFRFGGRDQRSMAPFDFVEGAGEHPHSVLLVNCIKAKRNGSSWKAITMAGGLTTMHIWILSSTFPLGPAVFAAGRPQAWQGCSCLSRRAAAAVCSVVCSSAGSISVPREGGVVCTSRVLLHDVLMSDSPSDPDVIL